MALVLVLLSGAGWLEAEHVLVEAGPLAGPGDLVVPHGSLASVGASLERLGIVRSAFLFRLAAVATRGEGPVHAAEFVFPAHASVRTVLTVLRTARPVQHRITIPEGLTASEIAELISGAPALTGSVEVPPEGSVLPQTYDYERGTTRQALLARMQAAMRVALGSVWTRRDPGIGLRSPRALLILASMVERETGLAAERPMVAAVFLNRLRLGMRLQSDPTAAYQATGGLGALGRRLTRADLDWPGATNTYMLPGLPAAPICSPGLASLQAVARPSSTDALYFVASGTGHVFAASLAEQDQNVQRYVLGTLPGRADQRGATARSATRAAPGAGPRRPIGRTSRPAVSERTSAAAR